MPEILAELNAAAGFVAEGEIQRHGPVERGLESDVLQSRWHGRSRRGDVSGDGLRVQRPRRQPEGGNSNDLVNSIHFVISFSPAPAQAPGAILFRRETSW